jgi:DNA-binding response OmpR family regulator
MIVASDPDERDMLAFALRKGGFAVAASADLRRVLVSWTDHPADLVLFSLGPGRDPSKELETFRAVSQAPLLVLVESPSEQLSLELLEGGADVLLTQPVSLRVLVAQARALMRRAGSVPSFTLPTLDLEGISLDPSTRTVIVGANEPCRLTRLEFNLLYVLMTHRGQVIPSDALVERVWGYTGEGNRELIRGLISRLRRKIEPEPGSPRFLETIPSVGYRFTVGEL